MAAIDSELLARPVAWLHEDPGRYDVVHDKAKELWLSASPRQVERYTIPLYPLYAKERRKPLSTDAACALIRAAVGVDPRQDGSLLKILRAVEKAHGVSN